jgi:peptidoglycan/xylan/chitin deacetylase (PgdA/CDA1 family)
MNPLLAQLKTALQVRAQHGAPLRLFFRDDDVDEDEASLHRLLDLFLRAETPISLGLIPGRLTDAAIALLAERQQQYPQLIELNQHGWQHTNHESSGKKCEFGPSRSFDEQLADIAAGQARMNAAFGTVWFPVFIPPWNRCTATTAQVLDELGFRVLSRDRGQAAFAGLRCSEIPVTLDLYQWRGGAALRPMEELIQALLEQVEQAQTIGVMLHHKVMSNEAFAFLGELLQLCQHAPNIERHTFQGLLTRTSRCQV